MCGVGVRILVRELLVVVETVKTAVFGNVAPCNVVYTDVSGNMLLPSLGILKWLPQFSPKRQ
jgi:hypothetical protein